MQTKVMLHDAEEVKADDVSSFFSMKYDVRCLVSIRFVVFRAHSPSKSENDLLPLLWR